jgi:hypothetical protein
MFICLRPLASYGPMYTPLDTLYTCIQYTYSHRGKGGGGRANQREGSRGNSSQSRIENTNMSDCIKSQKL